MNDAQRWVAEREPAAPPALAAHVDRALAQVDAATLDVVTSCLRAAERTLDRVLVDDGNAAARAAALDLLAADALVTYAFEAASETPDRLGDVAREAMQRLSRFGGPPPAPPNAAS